ncbi:unnamed protein product [Oreochromis niloticus]|nr:unnamed protein product [Mustela putorius furo]
MSAVTASLCSTLMFVLFVSADQEIITAKSGQNVTLTCRAPNNNITAVKWNRTDLVDKHVLFYQDGHSDSTHQHPSFKNRVDLQDTQMKDGDVSVILKDVTINDTGTYECRGYIGETWKLINSTNLHVVPPGPTGGHTEDGGKTDRIKEGGGKEDEHVGVAVSAAFLCAALLLVFGVVRFWIKRRLQSKTYDDPEITQPLTSSQEDSYTDDLKIS